MKTTLAMMIQMTDDHQSHLNHETGKAAQVRFQKQVSSLSEVIIKMGNPFMDDFPEVLTLDCRNCAKEAVTETLLNLEATGKQQYQNYMQNVIIDHTKSIHETIKRNNFPLFGKPRTRTPSKQGKQILTLKNNVVLFAQLYVAMQNRDSDMEEFFAHEVQSFPPSISDCGNLRIAKCDVRCLDVFAAIRSA